MSTATTNFGLLKPDVNNPDDQDLWGGMLNTDLDGLDSVVEAALNFVKSAKTSSFSVTAPTAGSTTIGDSKKLFRCDATGGAFPGNLPAASAAGIGFTVAFKKTDSSANAVTITAAGSDKIDGSGTFALSQQYAWAILVSDGVSAWDIMSELQNVTIGAYAGIINYVNQTTTIATTSVNKLQILGGGSNTLTMPLASSVPVGSTLPYYSQGGNNTFNRQGSDHLSYGSVTNQTSIAANGIDFGIWVNYGGTDWVLSNGGQTLASIIQQAILGGTSQSWTDVTGSRAVGSTYTNSTARPIMVSVYANTTVNAVDCILTVGGVKVSQGFSQSSGGAQTFEAIVPVGSTYALNGTLSISWWSELR